MKAIPPKHSWFKRFRQVVSPDTEFSCVETIKLNGSIFAEIQEYTAPCGHRNYFVELFDEQLYDASIALIHQIHLEDAQSILRESIQAIDQIESQRWLEDW